LDASEGAEMECVFVDAGLEFTVVLRETAAHVDIQGAHLPNRMIREGLEAQVAKTLTQAGGRMPDSVTCPAEGLRASVGESRTCLVTGGADQFDVAVTVTSLGGGTMDLDLDVQPRR